MPPYLEDMLPNQTGFYVTVHNQFTRPLGSGLAVDLATATKKANEAADRELATANANWKWRKVRTKVTPWFQPIT